MKALEIILRLIDKLLTAIYQKKAQNEVDKLEANPHDFFVDHFGGLQPKDDKANKANTDNSN
jgi:hypothetical protein